MADDPADSRPGEVVPSRPGLNDQASVSQADIACSNGWVHVVSRVATAAAYVFPPPMKNIFRRLGPTEIVGG